LHPLGAPAQSQVAAFAANGPGGAGQPATDGLIGSETMAFMIADASTHSDNAEINITPLVDVMLVLLIIFLVAAPVVVRQIELPLAASPPDSEKKPAELSLQIDASGSLQLDGSPLSLPALDRVLQLEGLREQAPVLKIHVAPDAAYAHMTEVMALARSHGLERFELQAR
jgi:biopolymer transport protein ExbD